MHTSHHIRADIAADVTARRIAAAAVPARRRRRPAPLVALAARLRPAAARRATQPAA